MEVHRLGGSRRARSLKVLKLLEQVGLPPAETARKYPHELSGGQRQRVAIAMALACDPPLVVLDEPTTDLDVTTQAQIIDLLNRLRQANSISLVYVTHNLAVVKEMCDRVAVMYAGEVVEEGPTDALFASPRHPYTRALIDAVPRLGGARAPLISLRGLLRRAELPPGCPLAPRCEFADALCFAQQQALLPVSSTQRVACRRWQDVAALLDVRGRTDVVERRRLQTDDGEPLLVVEDLDCTYGRKGGLFRRTAPRTVVREAHFDLKRGETLSLVGQSGSGKTTIARAVAGLLQAADGEITYKGRPLGALVAGRPKSLRREIQIILQNPDESLNPRQRVEQIIGRPLTLFGSCRGSARRGRVEQLLAEVHQLGH